MIGFKKKEMTTVSVEIDPLMLRLAALREGTEGTYLAAYRSVPVRTDEDSKAVIHDFIAELGSPRIRLVINLPRHQTVVRILALPSVDDDELKSMAVYQVVNGLPFPEEDIVSDMVVLEKENAGLSKVFLTIAQVEVIRRILKPFEDVRHPIAGFVLSSFALLSFIKSWRPDMAEGPLLIVSRDRDWVEINLAFRKRIYASRSVSIRSLKDPTGRITQECERTVDSCNELLAGMGIDTVLLVGDWGNMQEHLTENLEKKLHAKVSLLDPRDHPALRRSDPKLFPKEEIAVPLIGAALEPELDTLQNLLPQEEKKLQAARRNRGHLTRVGIWAGIWLFFTAGVFGWEIVQKKQEIAALENHAILLEKDAKQVSEIFERAEFLHTQLEFAASPLETLKELHKLVPSRIGLASIAYDSEGVLLLQGTARRLSRVMDLVNNLERSPLFVKAELRSSSTRIVQKIELVDFQVQCLMEVGR